MAEVVVVVVAVVVIIVCVCVSVALTSTSRTQNVQFFGVNAQRRVDQQSVKLAAERSVGHDRDSSPAGQKRGRNRSIGR